MVHFYIRRKLLILYLFEINKCFTTYLNLFYKNCCYLSAHAKKIFRNIAVRLLSVAKLDLPDLQVVPQVDHVVDGLLGHRRRVPVGISVRVYFIFSTYGYWAN